MKMSLTWRGSGVSLFPLHTTSAKYWTGSLGDYQYKSQSCEESFFQINWLTFSTELFCQKWQRSKPNKTFIYVWKCVSISNCFGWTLTLWRCRISFSMEKYIHPFVWTLSLWRWIRFLLIYSMGLVVELFTFKHVLWECQFWTNYKRT